MYLNKKNKNNIIDNDNLKINENIKEENNNEIGNINNNNSEEDNNNNKKQC